MIYVCGNHLMTSCDNFFAYFGLLLRVLCLLMCVTSLHFFGLPSWVLHSLVCVCDIFTFLQIVVKGFVIVCVCVWASMCNSILIKRPLGVLLSIVL
jgi:hypothetical protein